MIGVIALHAEAPRVFSAEDAAFLIHVASLVAHAIENARLYERTRRSLRELEHLSPSRRRDRARRVDRRPARVGGRGRAHAACAPSRSASTSSRRAATRCACAPRPAGTSRAPRSSRCPTSACELAPQRLARRREPHLGARRHALGRARDALGARRAARRGRGGAGLPRRAPGRRAACERARPRPRQLAREPDRGRASSGCS